MAAAITDLNIKQGNGTQPLPTLLSAQKLSGATTASLTAATGWDTSTAKHFRMYQTQVVNGQTVPNQSTLSYYKGTLAGTTLSNLTLIWSATGSDQTYPIGATVDLAVTSGMIDDLYNLNAAHVDQDGTLKAGAVDVTAVLADAIVTRPKLATAFASEFTTGWNTADLPAVSSVTNNGNRSYDITFASTVASTLSSGMRLRTTRTVAGQGYMGGLMNGSSHYFTKVTPTGTLSTVTDNFTLMAHVQPTSYATSYIFGRTDSTPANGFALRFDSTGQVTAIIYNAGNANFRTVQTYQSLPLNKKTHVAASWATGTVVIYFDGVSVPVSAAGTGGTAPTTAGTGGDFSVGRFGAYTGASNYFPGYISNVGVFNAVLTAATIKSHATFKLLGSETNCIGAWSLDNVATDATGTNNLTATGGVGYSNTVSPMGNNGATTTNDFALVMNVNAAVVTVQVPEGCTIPTSGGVTSVAYSVQGNPYGWVSDKGRWSVSFAWRTLFSTASNATFAAATGWSFTVPIGTWRVGYQMGLYNSTTTQVGFCLSDTSQTGLAITASDLSLQSTCQSSAAATYTADAVKNKTASHAAAATYVLYTTGATTSAGITGNTTKCELFAEPTGL